MQRRSPEEIASAVVALPVGLGLVFGTALAAGVTILVLSLTYGASAEVGGCPRPEEVVKGTARTEVADGATLAPAAAAPVVSATEAWTTACEEPGAVEATRSTATYGLLSGTRFGIEPPGKPVWIVTFEDACVPADGGCRTTELGVIVDALSADRLASFDSG